ncbi:indole-3-glycerol phosphate synthase TrpC [Corynebacterium sp. sy017]|uniref:indole-3-glycerol phosphate synthase TrpC n=1 Tax=unclassified Corynebacterium TaxID=2624378 RepID=UPI001186D3BF|nr:MULTISPECIES: indole-3-glycerol phosphate synthase TrpC [unclassified Corynebacterium]MBP3087916.1 indole-3-glycerol phosphate synthase TrpC [Corynebacterium sp. sy017]QDZ42884.1 indole-3-glycerol phosphate synthase TrpC [Corynebacterium sp. sy039]TSD92457.1 indole-3-glycerol phosphate synthase TrpC [Corynebacterium sp. SY003]
MTTVFDEIIAGVIEDVSAREAEISYKEMKARSYDCPPPRDAMAALKNVGCSIIAEVKKAAPGHVIAHTIEPTALAAEFEAGGAHMIACQTERRNFKGSLEDMYAVRQAVSVPVMCRDFIIDPYQIHEARYYGADMIPLRVGALTQSRLESLIDRTESLGMTALVEVHTPAEATRAMQASAKVIGINARDLSTMTIDKKIFADIAPGLPQDTIRVALSGVRSSKELLTYASQGADAVVIGEELVRAASPRSFTRALVAAGQHPSCPSRF